MVIHNIEPVFNEYSEILILGSFPSVKSREEAFYYANKQNRFWKVIAVILQFGKIPKTPEEKKRMLLENRIALWDVVKTCEVDGSSDTSIRNVVANDIKQILNNAKIKRIICNGSKAYELYNKYLYTTTGIEAVKLPSTSPANASKSVDMLITVWKEAIRDII